MEKDDLPLLEQIEAFLTEHDLSPITFGRRAMGDPHFVRDLRNGRRVWPETEAKARQFIATYVPDASDKQDAA